MGERQHYNTRSVYKINRLETENPLNLHHCKINNHKKVTLMGGASAIDQELPLIGQPVERKLGEATKKRFLWWTLFWWGGTGAT